MERGFLSQIGSGRGRDVKEKDLNGNKRNTTSGIGLSTELDDTMNKDTPVGVASAVTEGVTPSVADKTVKKEKLSPLEDTTVLGSFPPLSTPGTATDGNAPVKSLYANVTRKPNGKKLNFRILFTPGNAAYPVVANYVRNTWGKYGLIHSMFSSSTGLFSFQFSSIDGLYAMLENGPWFIRNNPLILKKWHSDENLMKEDISTVPVWLKLHGVPVMAFSEDGLSAIATKLADVKLKDNIVVAMPKLTRDGHYICNVRVEYELKPPRCASCKVFRHIHEECQKNTGVGEKKNLKKPSQTSRGVPAGSKIVLNSIDNDMELGTNEGTINLVNNEATSSGSSFMNVDNSSTRTTPIIDKIGKFEELLTSGKATLVDEADNPLKKVEYPDDYDSEDEVASVDNDMARSMASKRVGFDTQSLLEQWKDSYGNDDYDEDPYDDDMYEGQDLSQELQAIYDNLNIRVRGRKNK
ncbi:RNA-directed DNA polymerase, eukaryota, reverse transcriptase zinc-binding domain protein [Tanacetum coccineum]